MLVIHRKEQFDIVHGGIRSPWLVIGWHTPDHYARLFCIWSGGIWLRLWGRKRLCWTRKSR